MLLQRRDVTLISRFQDIYRALMLVKLLGKFCHTSLHPSMPSGVWVAAEDALVHVVGVDSPGVISCFSCQVCSDKLFSCVHSWVPEYIFVSVPANHFFSVDPLHVFNVIFDFLFLTHLIF